MKKFFIALCLTAVTAGSYAQAQTTPAANPAGMEKPKEENKRAPKFKFKEETFDFGTVKEGPVAEHVFEFKNTGKEPLIVQSASASCGCTTPEWPKEPIMPGKKGKIVVRYNTQGRVGPFNKIVYLTSNAVSDKERYELYIKGTVEAAPATTTQAQPQQPTH
jgi:hypothetical protein